jgi:hypothetical protein
VSHFLVCSSTTDSTDPHWAAYALVDLSEHISKPLKDIVELFEETSKLNSYIRGFELNLGHPRFITFGDDDVLVDWFGDDGFKELSTTEYIPLIERDVTFLDDLIKGQGASHIDLLGSSTLRLHPEGFRWRATCRLTKHVAETTCIPYEVLNIVREETTSKVRKGIRPKQTRNYIRGVRSVAERKL